MEIPIAKEVDANRAEIIEHDHKKMCDYACEKLKNWLDTGYGKEIFIAMQKDCQTMFLEKYAAELASKGYSVSALERQIKISF